MKREMKAANKIEAGGVFMITWGKNYYQQALNEFRNDINKRAGRRESDITEADRQRILDRAEQLRRTNENN
jgi:hypothetical protein